MSPTPTPRLSVPAEYLPLYTYLVNRYANAVVLRLGEIEDLLGFPLPDLARDEAGWWSDADASGEASPQSRAWTQADRTAAPRLYARTVRFERRLEARTT